MLGALTRKFALGADVSLGDIAERLPTQGLSSADLYALCATALMRAIREMCDAGTAASASRATPPPPPLVCARHFESALAEHWPSSALAVG